MSAPPGEQAAWSIYAGRELRRARVPLWYPYEQLGAPLVGNGRSAVFFPTMLMHFGLPLTWSFTLAAALKLLIAGSGAWRLAWRQGLSQPGRAMCAISFMLGGCSLGMVHLPLSNAVAVLPWALLAMSWVIESPQAARALAMALVVAVMSLGCGLRTGLTMLAGMAVIAAMQAVVGGRSDNSGTSGRRIGAIFVIILALAAGFLAAGVQWVPIAESGGSAVAQSMNWRSRLAVVASAFFPYGGHSAAWVGAVPLALALMGLGRGGGLPWRTMALAAMAATWFGPMLRGDDSATLAILAMAIAIFAGRGLDELVKSVARQDAAQKLKLVAGVLALLAIGAIAAGVIGIVRVGALRAVAPGIALLCGAIAVFVAAKRPDFRRSIVAILLALAAGDLLVLSIPANGSVRRGDFDEPVAAFLSQQNLRETRSRVITMSDCLPSVVASWHRIGVIRLDARKPTVSPRMPNWLPTSRPSSGAKEEIDWSSSAMRVLGARYLILPPEMSAPGGNWRRVFPDGSSEPKAIVYEQQNWLPRVGGVGKRAGKDPDGCAGGDLGAGFQSGEDRRDRQG